MFFGRFKRKKESSKAAPAKSKAEPSASALPAAALKKRIHTAEGWRRTMLASPSRKRHAE